MRPERKMMGVQQVRRSGHSAPVKPFDNIPPDASHRHARVGWWNVPRVFRPGQQVTTAPSTASASLCGGLHQTQRCCRNRKVTLNTGHADVVRVGVAMEHTYAMLGGCHVHMRVCCYGYGR